ncbi:MAG TPA: hypothetical protein VFV87_06540 [Pirellulaceae bacterium]|nr:hypothetical protein [Pirellulaceae bacterium]
MRFLVAIKPLLVLIGAIFGAAVGGRQVYIYWTERRPTPFMAESFAAEYAGQQWVSVTGRMAVEARSEMPNHSRPGWVSVYVPLVPPDWQRQDPVHVVASSAAMPAAQANAWAQTLGGQDQVTFTGVIRPLGGLNYPYVFPRLKFARPTITINENTQPAAPWGMTAFLTICLVIGALAAWRVWWLLRT